jgi:hypothetical protein
MVMRVRACSYVIGAINAAVGKEECPIPWFAPPDIFRSRQIAELVRLSVAEGEVAAERRSASSGGL